MEHWQNKSLENIIEWHPEHGWITEEWKDCKYTSKGIETDFTGLYKVSNFGRVKTLGNGTSNYSKRVKIMSQRISTWQYPSLVLMKNNKGTCVLIHRLMMQNFIPNPKNKRVVNHINNIKTDNRLYNLEWATDSENCKHGYNMMLINKYAPHERIRKGRLAATSKPVGQFTKDWVFIKRFDSATEALEEFNCTSIYVACREPKRTAAGFRWKYLTE